ncbi:SusC/RagA family TonB-linked outer membrane protein [Echinicola vietnamensis]|uniref:TonB-linked outer membrane protein, SusC/RagA family n=1 Tax=Echinicola vietnamensis (strain DSM 17526 / LMG 23754 / KMM 6221) TaxID=926556 RepID=L0G5B0_ECHVK|nr:TonB-dependent receptor [Echinicola vietnamensis]AGA80737.1 TonB-linked outer membrane protein, SusC/RagA family [Echinicola vietnamensis DSM 17526]
MKINLRKRIVQLTKYTFRVFVVQVLFMQVLFANPSNSQNLSEYQVRLQTSNASLREVLEMLEEQTDFEFAYNQAVNRSKEQITLHMEADLRKVLKAITEQCDFQFRRVEQNIYVTAVDVPDPELAVVEKEDKEIQGKVLDAQRNEPIVGATVIVQGTSQGTITDLDGHFSLDVPDDATALQVSFLGYEAKTVALGNQSTLTIYLREEEGLLEEVVVLGYDSQKKKDLTGAVSVVNVDEMKTLPSASVENMLAGRAPGVQVLSDNGPGGNVTVRIRGFGTVNNNDPLYIIDGTPVTNGLNTINPQDIESFQVLKDAAASSIYGSRAANGVVIITTKKGRSEETQITFDAYTGIQQAFNLPRMLSAQEYGDMLWQASENDGKAPASDVYGSDPNGPVIPEWLDEAQTIPAADVDWVNEIFQTAPVQSYNLTLSKGGDQGSHVMTLGYFNKEGVIKHTGFDRFSARFNSDYKVKDFLQVGENFNASLTRTNDVGVNTSLGSIVYDAFQFPSIVPVRDLNGNFGGNPINDIGNPLGNLYRRKDNTKNRIKLMGNVFAEAKLAEGLSFRTNLGMDYENYFQRAFSPVYDEILSLNAVNSLSDNSSFYYQMAWTNTLNYSRKIGEGTLDVLLGQESIENYFESKSASRQEFLYEDDNFHYLSYGTENQRNSGYASKWNLLSFFGKVNYNWKDRYLFSATLRNDGTSRLENNKWDIFPAFSAGWRISNEDFLNLGSNVDELKLRASWGQTGNQQVPSYSTLASFQNNITYSNYAIDGSQESVAIGLVETRVANPSLNWEVTTQSGVGVDLAMFDERLQVSADYYNKVTDDLLIYAPIPPTYGGTNDGTWINGGKMRNRGFELGAKYNGSAGEVFYTVGLNYSFYKNELLELADGIDYLGIPGSSLHSVNFGQEISRTIVGQPIGTFFGYESMGIFQSDEEVAAHGIQPEAQPGDLRFKDINGDGVLDANDRTAIGSPHPKAIIGFTTNFYYKGFDLALFFNGAFGQQIYNLTKYKTLFFNQSAYNKSNEVLDAWTPENTDTDIPRLSLDDENENIRPSSYYLENASYFKLNNLQVGYSFPQSMLGGMELRVYGQASNVFTITSYSGMTPEIGLQNYSSNNRNLDIGVDRGVYPPSRTFTLGFNVKF